MLYNKQPVPYTAESRKKKRLPTLSGRPMMIQGHRGGYSPENTMKSFRQALERGIEGIELDVRP
jgi:glycerophosphoryl diester phosphodiesterase